MIIWTGFGFLVAIIGFAALVLTELISESIAGNEQFYQQNSWLILVGMTVAAILTFGLHKILSLKKPKIVIDKKSGEEIEIRGSHSLFFIQVKWWPIVFIILGFVFMFAGGNESQDDVPWPEEQNKPVESNR